MTHKNILHGRVRHTFKTWVTPVLHAAGFKKHGNVYVRSVGHILHVVNSEGGVFNTSDSISFTLNCGVDLPGVVSTMWGSQRKEANPPEAASCLLHVPPGFLLEPKRGSSWDVTASDDAERDSEIGQELQSLIVTAALPFFDRLRDERSIAEFLSTHRTKQDQQVFPHAEAYQRAYAAIIWDMLGCHENCKTCVQEAIEFSRKTPGKKVIDAFVARFSCAHDEPPAPT